MREDINLLLEPDHGWFRTLAESTWFAVFAHRRNEIIYANPASAELTGYSIEELMTLDAAKLVDPQELERLVPEKPSRHIDPATREPIELRIRRKDGSHRWVAITNGQLSLAGHLIGIGTAVDITPRRQALETVERRLEVENVLTDLSRNFLKIGTDDLENGIRFAIERLGAFAGSYCTSIILFKDDQETVHTEFHCFDGRLTTARNPETSISAFGVDRRTMLAGKAVNLAGANIRYAVDSCGCSDAGRPTEATLIPLVAGDRFVGLLVFLWQDTNLLNQQHDIRVHQVSAEILATGISRIQAEAKLKLTRERFDLAQKAGRSVAWEWDPATDGMVMSASGAMVFDQGPDFLPTRGVDLQQLIPPEDRPDVQEAIRHALRTGQSYAVEHRVEIPSAGREAWISARATPIIGTDGRVERFVGVSADITERKLAERALREERERDEVTLASIADGVIRTDAEGIVDYLNPAAERLTGWSTEEAKGQPLATVYKATRDGSMRIRPDPVSECLEVGSVIKSSDWCSLFHRDGAEFAIRDTAAPIRRPDGEVLGAALVFRDVTHVRGLEREMAFQASHDMLTGLLNRREFESRVQEALANASFTGRTHALCFLDLDAFKVVNDSCGHSVGDKMLQQLAAVLEATARGTDILARLGGDEFGLLITDCTLDHARSLANNFLEALRDFRFLWDDRLFQVGVSIGIVPVDRDSPQYNELLAAADAACFVAKEHGRNRIHVSDTDDREVAARYHETQWIHRLNQAIENDRFRLLGQTITPLQSADAPKLVEILLRLEDVDETGEIISPDRFIPAAERYRMMPMLDRWVISHAFEMIRRLVREDPHNRTVYSLNLSGQSLADLSVLDDILIELDRNDIDPSRLCFEITETAAISNLAAAQSFIGVLRSRGCGFALDDFGSGLSSFRYLKDLPVKYLKIDGSLVRDIAEDPIRREMVVAIHRIGLAMGLQTIGEWVESESTLEALRAIGVDYAQGFAIEKPSPLL